MKILLLTKKNKICDRAKKIVQDKFNHPLIIQGLVDETLPEEVKNWRGDYLLSFLSPWIIPEEVLEQAEIFSLNFHPGSPKYPGISCYNFALYNNEKEYGVTCHEMVGKIDSGNIIKTLKFPINENETVLTLKKKARKYLLDLFKEIIEQIEKGYTLTFSNEKWKSGPYTKKDLQAICKINLDMQKSEIFRRIKATCHPKGPDYPYILYNSKKIVLKEINIERV